MDSSTWTPSTWSVFNSSIRTNNDVEGWHRRLNTKASRPGVPMYQLIPLLHREAQLVNLQMGLVKEGKMCRNQRRATQQVQGRIFKLWDRYLAGGMKTLGLLAACSYLHGPQL